MHVWLIEDNQVDVFVIRDILQKTGLDLELTVFEDGENTLARFNEPGRPCPDLVLLDLNLPRISGIDVLKAVRTSDRCGSVRVIVVTSSQSPEDRRAVEDLSGDAYFAKPGDLRQYQKLGDLIQQVLARPV